MIARLVLWLLSCVPHRVIYREGEKYLTRYYLLGGRRTPGTGSGRYRRSFNLFLHCFHTSDVPPAHNHPWSWARSLILRGAYDEVRVEEACPWYTTHVVRRYRAGMINRIAADDWHYVTLLTPTVWTLFLAGRNHGKGWGFLDGND